MTARRVALIPGAFALRAEYAGLEDPIPELRAAVHEVVDWLDEGAGPAGEIGVYCTGQQHALASELLARHQRPVGTRDERPVAVLAIGNGAACRTEKAPGFFDPRAADFDAHLASALVLPDPTALANVDEVLAQELLADVEAIRSLGGEVLTAHHRATVRYSDDPYGVQYWVVTWEWEMPDGA